MALSINHDGRVSHYRIEQRRYGRGDEARYFVQGTSRLFRTLSEFVDHHSKNAGGLATRIIHPLPKRNTTVSFTTNQGNWEIRDK